MSAHGNIRPLRGRLFLLWFAALTIAACGSSPPAIWASTETLESHRLSGSTELRSKHVESAFFGPMSVALLIDPSGAVLDAKPNQAQMPAEMRGADKVAAEAAKLASKLKFRPFIRDGRPMHARGDISISLLPLEKLPKGRVPFPIVDGSDFTITLDRSACYGSCPEYSVTIEGGGALTVNAGYNSLILGTHCARITRIHAAALLGRFRTAEFWSLDDQYEAAVTDNPTYILTVRIGSQSKTVVDYVGRSVGMPDVVGKLQSAVDEAADSGRWIIGNERTITALEAANFDFQSPEAAATLVRSIGEAPQSLSMALLNRGAPLDGRESVCDGCKDLGSNRSAAMILSVSHGLPRLFDRVVTRASIAALPKVKLEEMLTAAAHARSLPLVRRLVALGANPRVTTSDGTALLRALDDNYGDESPEPDQEGVVRFLLLKGAPLEARDGIGWTALQHSYDDHPQFARMLIAAGARVDAHGKDDQPLLYLTDDEDVALVALKAGANRNLKDDYGRKLSEIAQQKHWPRVQAMIR